MIIIAGILLIIFFVPVYILSFRKEHYKYAYFFVRLWCKGIFYGMGFRYELIKLTDKIYTGTKNIMSRIPAMIIIHPRHK
jgi:1-acyl-sn-glycerol-3-phosphate acyltransferase